MDTTNQRTSEEHLKSTFNKLFNFNPLALLTLLQVFRDSQAFFDRTREQLLLNLIGNLIKGSKAEAHIDILEELDDIKSFSRSNILYDFANFGQEFLIKIKLKISQEGSQQTGDKVVSLLHVLLNIMESVLGLELQSYLVGLAGQDWISSHAQYHLELAFQSLFHGISRSDDEDDLITLVDDIIFH